MKRKRGRPPEFDKPMETRIVIRIPKNDKKTINKIALDLNWPTSSIIRTMIRTFIEDYEATKV